MRSNILIRAAVWCLGLVFLLSCVSKKPVIIPGGGETRLSGGAKAALLDRVDRQQKSYTTISGRARCNLTVNDKDRYDVTANVRIVRDEAIWISVTAIMGVEIARVSITPDSVLIINRLQSAYLKRPFAYLRNFIGDGLDFSGLQQLLVGDAVEQLTENRVEVWHNASGFRLERQVNGWQYMAQLDTGYRNSYTSIAEITRDRKLEVFYSEHQRTAENIFPHKVDVSIITPGLTLRSEMRYNKVAYDENLELPFTIPSRFSEIQ